MPSRRAVMSVLALGYLAAHLPFLAPSLEDIDSINFALGLHHFDPALHQPHPPGYPVYIALGRMSLWVVQHVAPALASIRADALALSVWSAIGAAVALAAAWSLFASIAADARGRRTAGMAVAVLAMAPLFWSSGLRPMSDMAGLATVLVAQALAVRGRSEPRALVAGALVAGLAAGLRVQTLWLTLPLLVVAVVAQRRRGAWWIVSRPMAALAAGVLLWLVPLLVASGGIDAYVAALRTQAAEDFAWVDMVWADPTRRHIEIALYETLVLPWDSIPLATAVAIVAALGSLVVIVRERAALWMLVAGFLPYAILHLLFQETATLRYALPLVPPVAYLVAAGASSMRRLAPVVAGIVVVWAAFVALPFGVAYARAPHPAFRAIDDMTRALPTERPAAIFAHYALWRPLQTEPARALPTVQPTPGYEWMGPADYWRRGGTAPVWFLADARRTDLDLIDPQARRDRRHYEWAVDAHGLLSGVRPQGVDWYRLQPPGWFVTTGWSLTPEAGGITAAAHSGPDRRAIQAYVRARPERSTIVLGGRYLGAAGDGIASFELTMNGERLDAWTLDPAHGLNFLRVVDLPHGVPGRPGTYAVLAIAAHAAGAGRPTPAVAIRQFDVQSATVLMHAFGRGWYEDEYDVTTGRRWRWTSGHAELLITPPQRVRLTLRGDSPRRYFDAAPTVRITAGGRVIAALHPDADFTWQVVVPAADVLRSNGLVAVETDRVFVQRRTDGVSDPRPLGLRLFEVRVDTVLP